MGHLITTYFADNKLGEARVIRDNEKLMIEYYDTNNVKFLSEDHSDKSQGKVETIAEDWALGFRQLNG
jgi:hypothetical protein